MNHFQAQKIETFTKNQNLQNRAINADLTQKMVLPTNKESIKTLKNRLHLLSAGMDIMSDRSLSFNSKDV
ncbi:MAG: hypothetical protein COW00_09390 [Bdellovibrio sp. CG12_big_fil_rev_8_21_14_0_65_39_13]|nr:MAG: hypothetical protein COW78_09465 [Bdellovibrio sp. CG22_combo_CG10-13_8_21_14_all_39_27]PIQ59835.1 MAG: hypothetical protein COW00_09390 [Bdellovibrio sp. CG12_big_fil_rev_8_21_14_0_65_39_13]PIR36137.1 MAG: hypothetical protein COV37_04000 [Bdellovibrio sp. CG11_big_fil_rev_8_21_14_0_20_39_38]PJB53400.1 MAG: hypothetical protein CO099_07345 [Bdellovibrio sp. CG_4_9_14_3_um_filter_39_7]